ncbi:hypothetical protein SAMN05661008_01226 [Alkalithermobacter thermoalcaliphilus JW-YL-7 = DSM 7308]|uniref:Uncharacterized protein n=1 Tax=Alkalithermobacter thermoalcaliphilus JW-YL-7 = DSM 7308 TaxID=1121328 RepID=A0A150FPQ1_CLOPD|nr:hypothetical protein JWYL7_0658 [[Clostridium] paradoxum JW-YL-7 = DSM 7308]SHK97071.1 hypothetical protein SAMN05661008_01226 [[Clostridium] paradoxum JW-YL-7 = DSM 7308]
MKEDRLERLEKKIEELSIIIDKSRIREYADLVSNPKRLIIINLIAGLARGLGTAVGLTILAAILFYILRSWVNLPLIGEFIARLLDIVENYR